MAVFHDQQAAQASGVDTWAYYQAKSTKQSLAELARDLASDEKKPVLQAKIGRYDQEKSDIKKTAEALEARSKELDEQSEQQMHLHHRWAQATTALQISIALAAIALLTRRKWLEWGMFGVAGLGIVLGGAAMMHL